MTIRRTLPGLRRLLWLSPLDTEIGDEAQRCRTLHYTCLTLFSGILLAVLAAFSNSAYGVILVLISHSIILLGVVWLYRHEHVESAAHVLCFSTLACAIVFISTSGQGFHDPAVIMLPMALVLGALLISRRSYIVFCLVFGTVCASIVFLEKIRILPLEPEAPRRLSYFLYLAVVLSITAVVAGLLARQLKDSLSRSRRYAKALGVLASRPTLHETEFFETLALELSRALGVTHVMIAQRIPGDDRRMRTLALTDNDMLTDGLEYSLENSPSQDILLGGLSYFDDDVQKRFPLDRFLLSTGVTTYMGIALHGSSGNPLGLIALMNRGRFDSVELARSLLSISSTRAASELERLSSARQFRMSEQRYRTMIDNLGEGVINMDAEGRLQNANPAAEHIFGVHPDELPGQPMARFIPEDQSNIFYEVMESSRRGEPSSFEIDLLGGDGVRRTTLVTTSPRLDAEGKLVELLGVLRDVTEYRLLQEQYIQASKLEGIGRLAGGIAHDFNNLLTVINGYSAMLLEDMKEPSVFRSSVAQIHNAGERAADLTRQLLSFSRKQMSQPTDLDLNGLIRGAETMFRRLLGEDVLLLTELAEEPQMLHADPTQIHQVLLNLVVNARDAMPLGGTLTIATRTVTGSEVPVTKLSETFPSGFVLLEVEDTGTGMNEEVQRHLFEPFYSTKGDEGTGLGLATVYGIVRQSQGTISVFSEPGTGSTFRIFLPRAAVQSEASQETVAIARSFHGPETVLVVEDQEDVRGLATHVLASYGYDVLSAATGDQALQMASIHSEPIHLLLTDVVLPGMNGRELSEKFLLLHPETRVLFTSGYTDDIIARRGVRQGSIAFLPKPYSPEALAAKVLETIASPAKSTTAPDGPANVEAPGEKLRVQKSTG